MAEAKTILVVDDEQDSVEFVAEVLEAMGDCNVLKAYDGEEAVNVARERLPDLVVMDVNMPKKDGYTAFTEMRKGETTSGIPVIILSSMSSFGEFVAMNPDILQPRFFLDKPIEPAKLMELVERVLAE